MILDLMKSSLKLLKKKFRGCMRTDGRMMKCREMVKRR